VTSSPLWAILKHLCPVFSAPQHTLLTQVVCDYTGAIRWAEIGRPGAMTDRSHFKDSAMYRDPDSFFTTHQVTETLRVREHVNGDNIYIGDGCAARHEPCSVRYASRPGAFRCPDHSNVAGTACASAFSKGSRNLRLNCGLSWPCRCVLASVKSSVIRKVACVQTRKRLRQFNSGHYSERVIVENSIGRLVRARVLTASYKPPQSEAWAAGLLSASSAFVRQPPLLLLARTLSERRDGRRRRTLF
jgi:hypothetical protein